MIKSFSPTDHSCHLLVLVLNVRSVAERKWAMPRESVRDLVCSSLRLLEESGDGASVLDDALELSNVVNAFAGTIKYMSRPAPYASISAGVEVEAPSRSILMGTSSRRGDGRWEYHLGVDGHFYVYEHNPNWRSAYWFRGEVSVQRVIDLFGFEPLVGVLAGLIQQKIYQRQIARRTWYSIRQQINDLLYKRVV